MLGAGETSCTEIVGSVLKRISAVEPHVGAFITVDAEGAERRAKSLDAGRRAGWKPGPLWGIPIGVKDNICTKGMRTTCASKMLAGYVPPYDATVVERLIDAGAILIGKTNMDEFGMGSSTEHSALAATVNPWDATRVPGGSSGGSAAAVGSGEAVCSLGSDTGGSVRLPASFCGLVGLRPTYGAISRYGLVAFGSSTDQIGPITRSALDCAALLNVLAGPDKRDSTSLSKGIPRVVLKPGSPSLKGKRLGVPRRLLDSGVDGGVKALFEEALETLGDLGAEVIDVDIMDPSNAVAAYYVIANAEASSNLARFDGVRYGVRRGGPSLEDMYRRTREQGFGTEVKRRIVLGTYVLSAGYYDEYYLKARRVRELIAREMREAFERMDLIAVPSAATEAFALGERMKDPVAMYMTDVFTVAAALAGLPALTLPMGLTSNAMPVGFQLIGPPRGEDGLLEAGHMFEQVTTHHTNRPSTDPGKGGGTSAGWSRGSTKCEN